MPTYLITPNTDREDKILQRFAAARDIKLQWITVDPNPNYDGETTVVEEAAWNGVSSSVADALTEERPAGAWPCTPLENWNAEDRRTLIHQAVTRWGYAGDAGIDVRSLIADLDAGRVHNP